MINIEQTCKSLLTHAKIMSKDINDEYTYNQMASENKFGEILEKSLSPAYLHLFITYALKANMKEQAAYGLGLFKEQYDV